MKKRLVLVIGMVFSFVISGNIYAISQDSNISFLSSLTGKNRLKEAPIRISSNAMDVYINKNTVIFTGRVSVDDQDVKINCHKMTIKLKQDPNDKNNKTIDTITCIGEVIVNRKLYDAEEISQGEQRVEAGKAVWNVGTATIVLTEKPVLRRGVNNLKGEEITIDLNNETMKVDKEVNLEFRQNHENN
jgi:lipopolysaccharide transport protein LptA